jgi:adenine-specific DNA-methyltransferase
MKYGARSNGKEHGVVMTKPEVVCFMLDISGYDSKKDLSKVKICDPAAGEGAFIKEIVRRLFYSSKLNKFSFDEALKNITAIEIDKNRSQKLQRIISDELALIGLSKELVSKINIIVGDSLIQPRQVQNIIVGNPPYIRHEQIPNKEKLVYRKNYKTFRHRADLYIPFYESSLNALSVGGKLCFICSDRWMSNTYGKPLREMILSQYNLSAVIKLHEVDVFEEEVCGYPSITLIANEKYIGTRYAIASKTSKLQETLQGSKVINLEMNQPWIFNDNMRKILNNLSSIEEQGFKIGIGVATGADSVFIGDKLLENVEKSRAIPVVMNKDISKGQINWGGKYLLNPYADGTRRLVTLKEYPRLKKYLESHTVQLKGRHIVKKQPSEWYKTIDGINQHLQKTPKLLIPDIKKDRVIALDEGKYYPHHNVYYITHRDKQLLEALGAVLMSDLCTEQVSAVGVVMSGGYPRWQSQTLRKLRIPNLQVLGKEQILLLVRAFRSKNVEQASEIVKSILRNKKIMPIQKTLIPLMENQFELVDQAG